MQNLSVWRDADTGKTLPNNHPTCLSSDSSDISRYSLLTSWNVSLYHPPTHSISPYSYGEEAESLFCSTALELLEDVCPVGLSLCRILQAWSCGLLKQCSQGIVVNPSTLRLLSLPFSFLNFLFLEGLSRMAPEAVSGLWRLFCAALCESRLYTSRHPVLWNPREDPWSSLKLYFAPSFYWAFWILTLTTTSSLNMSNRIDWSSRGLHQPPESFQLGTSPFMSVLRPELRSKCHRACASRMSEWPAVTLTSASMKTTEPISNECFSSSSW